MPTDDEIRLAAGEMSAQELRTAKAVLAWFIRRSVPEAGAVRWVPVDARIALTRINEVTIGLPIFGHDQEGQWYRLDGAIREPQQEQP